MSTHRNPTILFLQDGDRRWAKQHGKTLDEAYDLMARKIALIIDGLYDRGYDHMYMPGCSVANMSRPAEQIPLFLDAYLRLPQYTRTNVRITVGGNTSLLPADYQERYAQMAAATAEKTDFTFNLLMCWSVLDEITRIAQDITTSGEKPTPQNLLAHSDIPEPIDLIIRTGKRNRLSSFTPLSGEYAEIVFSDVLFPDFTLEDLDQALGQYEISERTYGK